MKRYDPDVHHRRSIRLRDFDYAADGAYFVTVCVQGRECLFGDVVDGVIVLSEAGRMIEEVWCELPNRYPGIATDGHVVMPDHFHGIISIDNMCDVGAPLVGAQADSINRAGTRPAPTLGDVIGTFKSLATLAYIRGVEQNNWPPFPGRLWQRNYFERIIRDDAELQRLREYVAGNPKRWAEDGGCPENMENPGQTRGSAPT